MTKKQLKAMKVKECVKVGKYFVRRESRYIWRVAEVEGMMDWLMSGDAQEVAQRIYEPQY